MKTILFLQHYPSPFILIDQRILESKYRVIPLVLSQRKRGLFFPLHLLEVSLLLLRHAAKADAFVTWFGDYHSAVMVFWGRLLGKRTVIFAGGQEAVCYPELKKGVYYKKWRGMATRYALSHASAIIANHESLLEHQNFYYGPAGKKDGIRHYIPGIRTPMSVIPNGLEVEKFRRDPAVPKEPGRVLTMGRMLSHSDFLNKGFDLFVEAARRNPDLSFVIIGLDRRFLPWIEEHYRISEIPNLERIFFFCPYDEVVRQFNRAAVFVQASITEGMPFTLLEAMLCECVPVGSRVNGIPDAIGETGVIVDRREVGELEAAIRRALTLQTGPAARARVVQEFSLARRRERLLALMDSIL